MSNEKWSQKPIITNPTESTRICLIDGSPIIENKTISIENFQEYMNVQEVLSSIERENLSKNSLTAAAAYPRRPVAVLTFDDGLATDITYLKPIMDEYGVKGTLFVNSNDIYGTPKLTDEQIKTLYNEGWDFGSHTHNHQSLGKQATEGAISLGATTIKILNDASIPLFRPTETGTKFIIQYTTPGSPEYIVTAIDYSLEDSILTLTLDSPTTFSTAGRSEIWLHEEEVDSEIVQSLQYLESLGIPCSGFAYPFGGFTDISKQIVQKYFPYGRTASSVVAGITGGIYDYDELPFKQFEIPSTEIVPMTSEQMDTLIAEAISKNGLVVFLGHSVAGTTFQTQLELLITKLQAADILILTMSQALRYHSNAASLSEFYISKNGNLSNGTAIIPRGSYNSASDLENFPMGISIMRSSSVDDTLLVGEQKFPTVEGTLITFRSSTYYIGYWTFQYWHDTTTNDIYYRNSTGRKSFLAWQKLAINDLYKELSCGEVTILSNSSTSVELTGKTDTTGKILADSGLMNLYTAEVTPYAYEESWRLIYQPYVASGKLYVRIFNTLPAGNDLTVSNLRLNVSLTKVR